LSIWRADQDQATVVSRQLCASRRYQSMTKRLFAANTSLKQNKIEKRLAVRLLMRIAVTRFAASDSVWLTLKPLLSALVPLVVTVRSATS
jgi:hypothetical protein